MNRIFKASNVVAAWLLICGFTLAARAGDLTAGLLRCEYQVNPLTVDTRHPRLFWIVTSPARGAKQTAYQILVASSPQSLAADQGDLWDSGKVASDETTQIEYRGCPLASEAECFWKVRVWDTQNRPSAWSQVAQWTMGLLKPEDWRASWICADYDAANCHTMDSRPSARRRTGSVIFS